VEIYDGSRSLLNTSLRQRLTMAIQRAFVTGGSGFVGRNLIAALKGSGAEVRALARSATAMWTVERAGAEPVAGNLDDEAALRAGMSGCDVVFHAAAQIGDWGNFADFYRTNVAGTEHVLAAACTSGVPRLVHISTEAVLIGGPPLVHVDETRPRPRRPVGLDPITKGMAEARVLAADSPGLTTVVVRPRFVWGAGDTSVLPQFVAAVRQGTYAWIDGGRYPTSTCHVANACEGLLLAAEFGRGGEIYFLTDGPPVEVRAFGTALLRTQGLEAGDRSVPRVVAWWAAVAAEALWRVCGLAGRPPITRMTVRLIGEEVTVDDAKARRELGYQGRLSYEEGLAAMARAHAERSNIPDG
jgi:nucleoside-diphosphate-sugar epimerase